MIRSICLVLALQAATPAQLPEIPTYDGLAVWSQDWSDICLMTGFWQPMGGKEGPTRLQAKTKGSTIRMSSRLSLRECSYTLPVGGEVLFDQGWIFISGDGDMLNTKLPSMAKLWGNKVNRDGETSKMVNADYVERYELTKLSDWSWTQHDCKKIKGYELWNAKAKKATVVGMVYEARGPKHKITASGNGTRLHMCSPGKDASLTYNEYQSPEAAKAAHERAMAKIAARKRAKAVEASEKKDKD